MRKNEAIWIAKQNRWRIMVQVDGVRKCFYSSQKGKKGKIEAEQKADKFINAGVLKTDIRLNSAYNQFIDYISLHTGGANVKKHISTFKTWILPVLEHRKVSTISTADWQSCIDKAFQKGRAKKTLCHIRASITAFLNYCADEGIEYQPLRVLKINKNAYVKEKIILQPDEVKQLLSMDESDSLYIYAFQFLAMTGLRPSELCRLKEADIKQDILTVQKSKTDAGQRSFYLTSYAKAILDKQDTLKRTQSLLSPYVFPNFISKKENVPNYLYKAWKQLGFNCTLYALRHTFVSIGRVGVPEELMKLLVGHTQNMDTYGTYGHELSGDKKQAATLMEHSISSILKI